MPLIEDGGNPGLYFTGGLLEAEAGLYSTEGGVTPTYVVWRGLLIAGISDGNTPFYLREITGWDSLPNITFGSVPVAGGLGSIVTPGQADPRVVTVTGWCWDPVSRNELLAILRGNSAPSVGDVVTESLTVTHGGLTLSADAQLMKADATAEVGWALGRFPFVLQWRCPDPLRYGAPVVVSSPINTAVSGLAFPWTFPVTFPSNPIGGSVSVVNGGNARAPVVVTLTGPLDGPGVVCVESSVRVEFPLTLGASDVLTVDSGSGVALLNGEYRAPSVLSSLVGDLSLRPGRQTLQALGVPSSGSPGISVSFRPAFW